MGTVAWPHAPTHRLGENGTFIVTAGTYLKEHYFKGAERLRVLERGLLKLAQEHGWQLEAWAMFSNHYHFVAHSPREVGGAENLSKWIGVLHAKSAGWINKLDGCRGRKVWHNFWETRLTFESSYLARLSYVHQNPVLHGLVQRASNYPWCSAGWFERTGTTAQVRTIYGFKTDAVRVTEFEPSPEVGNFRVVESSAS